MSDLGLKRLLHAAFTLFIVMLGMHAHADRAKPKVMMVLDGSSSMWGQIDGKPKIKVAREVVKDLVNKWGDRMDLGLVTYGHRRRSDCKDIQTLVKPGPNSSAKIIRALRGIKPRGKTPLSAAVMHAARQLDFTNKESSVILISDGLENCGLDPCKVARRLASQGVNFKAHVIGYDLSDQDASKLKCLPKETGGVYVDADNETELKEAIAKVFAEEVQRTGKDTLVPVLAPDQEPLKGLPISWRVLDAKSTAMTLASGVGEKLEIDLKPGVYNVEASLGRATTYTTIEVTPDIKRHAITLDMGILYLTALAEEGVRDQDVSWRVANVKAAAGQDFMKGRQVQFYLPAGDYQVIGARGHQEKKEYVKLDRGEIRYMHLDFRYGLLRVHTNLAKDAGVRWLVNEKNDKDDSTTLAHDAAGGMLEVSLPPGRYEVVARQGASRKVLNVRIQPGYYSERNLSFTLGGLSLSAKAANVPDAVVWSISRKTAKGLESVGNHTGVKHDLKLADGTYVVKVAQGNTRAETVVDVSVGKSTPVEFVLAGSLETQVSGEVVTSKTPIYWEVYPLNKSGSQGAQLVGTRAVKGTFDLPPGLYRVVGRTPKMMLAKTVVVNPGATSQLVLTEIDRVKKPSANAAEPVYVSRIPEPVTAAVEQPVTKPEKVDLLPQVVATPAVQPRKAQRVVIVDPANKQVETTVEVESVPVPRRESAVRSPQPQISTPEPVTPVTVAPIEPKVVAVTPTPVPAATLRPVEGTMAALAVAAYATEGGAPITMSWAVFPYEGGVIGERRAFHIGANHQFDLEPGRYRLVSKYQRTVNEVDFELKAGEVIRENFVLNLGTLQVKAVDAATGQPMPVEWQLHVLATKGVQGAHIAQNIGVGDSYTLPQGQYLITGVHPWGEFKARVIVKAGKKTEKMFPVYK